MGGGGSGRVGWVGGSGRGDLGCWRGGGGETGSTYLPLPSL